MFEGGFWKCKQVCVANLPGFGVRSEFSIAGGPPNNLGQVVLSFGDLISSSVELGYY